MGDGDKLEKGRWG